jgi:hypothetical protein
MAKRLWAGIGAGALSVAGLFGLAGKSNEPPPKDEPGAFTTYLNEVTARIEAMEREQGYRFARAGERSDYFSSAFPAASVPASGAQAATKPRDNQPAIDSSFDGRLRSAIVGLSSAHIGVAVNAYNNAYDLIRDEMKDKSKDELNRIAQEYFGTDWNGFVKRVDQINAQEQNDMALKVDSMVNLTQGAAHLGHDALCQLSADIGVLSSNIQRRIDMRGPDAGNINDTAGLAQLESLRERYHQLNDVVRAVPTSRCGGPLLIVEPK